jgi:chorismate mutase/prephenate dehydratase
MTRTLPELRTEIDAVDTELLALLNKRAALASKWARSNGQEGSTVFRPEREAQVIRQPAGRQPGPIKNQSVAHDLARDHVRLPRAGGAQRM